MDALCTPTIATAAIFVSLLFLDLFRRDFELLPGHGFFGVVCVLLMAVLCQYGAEMAAWGFLVLPFVILIIGLGIQATESKNGAVPYPTHVNPSATQTSCQSCRGRKMHYT